MIDAHRGAFEYDWRTRFHLPLSVVGKSMTWGEAVRHTRRLSGDPSAAVGAEVNRFDRPTSREALILMDVYDSLEFTRAGRKAKKYPRPWGDKVRKGLGTRLSPARLRAILDAHRAKPTEGANDG